MASFFSRALTVSALALTLVGSALLPASAGEVQNRIDNQQARIHQGVRSGQLTAGERNRDERHLHSIARERNRDLRRNGGYLTRGEQAHINRRLNANSRRIYRTKHNGVVQ